jgi:integrase/recombinase XerD
MYPQAQITAYLNYCKSHKKLNEKTIRAYNIDLEQFCQYTPKALEEVDKADILAYISHLHKFYAPRTAKRKIASLRALLNWLEFEDLLAVNPINRIRTKFQEPKVLPRTIPLVVIENILIAAYERLENAETDFARAGALRNAAMIELLFATGMRVSELCSLQPGSINLADGDVLIMGKGAKERVLQIGNAEVLEILRRYSCEFSEAIAESGFFFINRLKRRVSEQSVRELIKNLCVEAGSTLTVTPHMFRHTFATLLLEENVDIRYIQGMLGHSSIQTTQIYTKVSLAKQRKILELHHPRNKIVLKS